MKPKDKCTTPYCRNKRIHHRTKCSKCNMQWLKEHHPETYFYNVLRSNAKRRGHKFTLTLSEFKQFCRETNYLELKGKSANSASIDRIRSWEGYHINNLQILTLSENTIKENKRRKCPF